MSRYLDRLRRGERCWAAEIVLRTLGFLLLAGCGKMAFVAHQMTTTPPPHETTVDEFTVCAATFLLLTSGLACTLEGPGLFRQVPIPPRRF